MKIRILFVAFYCMIVFEIFGQATRAVSGFDQIAISGGFDKIILQEGSTEGVSIAAEGISADKIVTEVKGGTLEIGMKKGNYKNFKATITVTYKSLIAIRNSGSSDLEALTAIKGESFKFHSSGSGDFKGIFDVKKLEVAISGSSDLSFSGNADHQEFAISGSGDIQAAKLKGKEADVAISGSGEVQLGVDGPVHTSVSGSGKVNNN